MTTFQEVLNKLNPEQREAVDRIDGPVMVLAGPGTGKTHVLAARIGNILAQTDTPPQSILCLTFTDAAAASMRKRLLGMIGPEAYKVPIYTFHGFCNRVIQENLDLFGSSQLEPVSDLERLELLQELLESLPVSHALRAETRSAHQYERHLGNIFALMKREGWTPGFVQERIASFLEDLPNNPGYQYKINTRFGKKGEVKKAAAKQIRKKMELLSAASKLYPEFQDRLRRIGRYEYDDMLLWVLNAFKQHEGLLRNYQERYLYFLVDEYQDTNSAQFGLLQKLLDFWDQPNVFVVGDDDQSIFEFQGARLQNLIQFYQQYKSSIHPVVLTRNYRSSQNILDASASLIQQNNLRAVSLLNFHQEKNLKAERTGKGQLSFEAFPNRSAELTELVLRLESLNNNDTEWEEMAVLYYKHKQAETLMDLLRKKGIPFQTKRPVDILQLPLINQLLDLLWYLNEELSDPYSGDARLFRMFHAGFWEIPPIDLARIALFLRERAEAGEATRWREAIGDTTLLQSLNLNTPVERWLEIQGLLDQWITQAANLPLAGLIEPLINQSGLLRSVIEHTDKIWWTQVISRFYSFVQEESQRLAPLSLNKFLKIIEKMQKGSIALPVQQIKGEQKGVQLLTVHAAKGLEFDHVFLIDCSTDYWEPSGRGNPFQFALPETLTITNAEEDVLEARRRLFYVALTRARKGLYLSYALENHRGKPQQPARFALETGIPMKENPANQDNLNEMLAIQLQESIYPEISLPENAHLERFMENFRMSVSSMNKYLRCPLAFYFEEVLQAPSLGTEPAVFGQAMHLAVQQYFLQFRKAKEELPGPEVLKNAFAEALHKRKSIFSPRCL